MKTATIAFLALAPLAQAHDVWLVDELGHGDFVDLQAAVDAAESGDTLLVRPGYYEGPQIDSKGLQVVAITPGTVFITHGLEARDRGFGSDLFLAGVAAYFRFRSGDPPGACLGGVLLQDIGLAGGLFSKVLVLAPSSPLVLVDCHLRGQNGEHGFGASGESGLGATFSSTESRVFVYRTRARGGAGGDGHNWTCEPGGDGGAGIWMGAGFLFTNRVEALGGSGGDGCPVGDTAPPIEVESGATHVSSEAPPSRLSLPYLAREGETFRLRVNGPSRARVDLLVGTGLQARFLGVRIGTLHLADPIQILPLGALDPLGHLQAIRSVPPVPAGSEGRMTYFQALITDRSGRALLTNPAGLVSLAPER